MVLFQPSLDDISVTGKHAKQLYTLICNLDLHIHGYFQRRTEASSQTADKGGEIEDQIADWILYVTTPSFLTVTVTIAQTLQKSIVYIAKKIYMYAKDEKTGAFLQKKFSAIVKELTPPI